MCDRDTGDVLRERGLSTRAPGAQAMLLAPELLAAVRLEAAPSPQCACTPFTQGPQANKTSPSRSIVHHFVKEGNCAVRQGNCSAIDGAPSSSACPPANRSSSLESAGRTIPSIGPDATSQRKPTKGQICIEGQGGSYHRSSPTHQVERRLVVLLHAAEQLVCFDASERGGFAVPPWKRGTCGATKS